ncbi:hypothetical protein GCM10009682_51870 [Luedemannella flava]|uniref:Uncharacterized protein n=1 Tax=Luedemannella flava TaxID=349316 RepID=A0ABN2MFZ3_9ACTN
MTATARRIIGRYARTICSPPTVGLAFMELSRDIQVTNRPRSDPFHSGSRGWCKSGGVRIIHSAAEAATDDIPGVVLVGVVVGGLLLLAAIRAMFGGRRK